MRLTREKQKTQDALDRRLLAFWHPLLKRLLPIVREIERDMTDIQARLRDPVKASRFLAQVGSLRWAHRYEQSFLRQYVTTLVDCGATPLLRLLLQPSKALRAIEEFSRGDDTTFEIDVNLTPKSVGAIFAIRRTVHCFVACGRTLNAVMASAKKGDGDALLYALRIDPSILLTRTAQDHIARASTRMNPKFFPSIGNALLDPVVPSDSFDLDWCLLFLIYTGPLGKLSRKATCELFIDRLKLYSSDPDSLWKKARRLRASKGTKKRGDLSSKRGTSAQ